MLNLKDFFTATQYRITEGSNYGWDCYGPNAYAIDAWNGDHNGHSATVIFDRETQEVYEVQIADYKNQRAYRLINEAYKDAFKKECDQRSVPNDDAWDEVQYIDLEVDGDMIDKLTKIFNGEEYDDRVVVQVNLSDEDQLLLMRMAHERDITFNELVCDILEKQLSLLTAEKEGEAK